MNLKDLLTIDKTIRRPPISERVVSQIIELADNGLLTVEMSELPDYPVFAKEIGVTRVTGNKIYNELSRRGYGHYNEHGFTISCKPQALQQLQDSVSNALKCGISFEEIVLEVLKYK